MWDTADHLPAPLPGVPQRMTSDYVRAGTTTLFAALDVASGCQWTSGSACGRT